MYKYSQGCRKVLKIKENKKTCEMKKKQFSRK